MKKVKCKIRTTIIGNIKKTKPVGQKLVQSDFLTVADRETGTEKVDKKILGIKGQALSISPDFKISATWKKD